MSATEQLLERVKTLDETQARTLLDMINQLPAPAVVPGRGKKEGGVWSVRSYARKYDRPPRTTAEWMKELREGERA